MTGQADGTVYINSTLDASGLKPGSKEIEAACRRAANSVKGMGEAANIAVQKMVNAFIRQNQMYAQQEQKVENLKKKLDELKNQKIPTDAFSALEKEAEGLNAELDKVKAKQKEWIDMGFPESDAIQKTKKDYDEIAKKIDQVKQKQDELVSAGKAYTLPDTSAINEKLIAETERLGQMNNSLGVSYDILKYKIEQYGGTMSGLFNQHAVLRKSFNSVYGAVKYGVSIVGKVAQKAYNGFLNVVNKLKNAMHGLHEETKKSNTSIGVGIRNILKYTLGISGLVSVFRNMRSAVKEGMGNLALYSNETNASLSALKSSLTQLKNSLATAFAPILTVIAPILTKFINMLSTAITYVGMFFAALTGQTSFKRAVAVQESYAGSLGDTASAAQDVADATKEAEKATDNYLSGLDEIRKYESPFEDVISKDSGNKGGGAGGGISPSDMFEEVEIPQNILDLADKIKDILSKLFEPLRKAWEQEGQFVMDAWKYALDEVWKLIKDIGRDFLTVWQEDETVAILANILHIIGDIGLVVGHLARNFREAWNTNEVGLNILRNIRDVIGIIVQHIRNMADATVEWADKLNFYPILDAFERFLKSIEPVVNAIWGIIEDFYTKVLLPLSKWTIEKGLPDLLQVFIDFNDKVDWASLRSNFAELWERLEPFAETVGEGLIIFIRRVSDALANFLNSKEFKDFLKTVENWMDNVDPDDVANGFEKIAKAIIALKAALIGITAIKGIATIIDILSKLGTAFQKFWGILSSFVTFIKGINFSQLFASINPGMIGEIGIKLEYLLQGTFLDTSTWEGLPKKINDAVNDVIDTVMQGLGQAFLKLFDFTESIQLFKIAGEWFSKIKEDFASKDWPSIGIDIINGLINGLLGAIVFITQPIKNIFDAIYNGICDLFGIHSPSTVMQEVGVNIVQGLINGITSLIESLSAIWETMKQTAIETWESVKESVVETWENIKESAAEKWEEIKEKISTKTEEARQKITDNTEQAKQNWADGWNNMSETVSSILETIKSAIQSAFEWISEKVAAIKEKLSSIGGGISGAVSSFFGGGSTYSISASGIQTPIMPVSQIATANIPYLASGAVIPPNAPFLAVLGDQKRGTNIEAPLSAIEDTVNKAVQNAMSKQQRTYVFNAQMNRRTIFSEMIAEAKLHQTVTGRNPFELA